MSIEVLGVKGLRVVKGHREILEVSALTLNKGEFLVVTGPNGAGKSTLLKAMAFLESVSGELRFNGVSVKGSGQTLEARRQMAMVFQDPLLLSGTPLDNVMIGLRLRGVTKDLRLEKAAYWLKKLNIAHLAERDVRTLSGGEAQRVNLARAMALEPQVLFLDEPFTYLDMPTKAALVSELKEILSETGITTMMVTHDLTDVPFLADRIAVLVEGRVKQIGPVSEVLAKPRSRQVAEFLGMENLWPGKIAQGSVSFRHFIFEGAEAELVLDGQAAAIQAVLEDSPVLACVRPEYVSIVREGDTDRTRPNVFSGIIEAVYPYGYYYRLKVNAGFAVTVLGGAIQFARPPKVGDRLRIYIPPEKIHLITKAIY